MRAHTMPESKHRRKGRARPRQYQTVPPEKNPVPSPTWLPATAVGLLAGGVLVILLGYLDPISNRIAGWPVFGSNWGLILGFALLVAGFVFLTRWK